MRKKMLLLALLLTAVVGVSSRIEAAGTHPCPRCRTNPDGSQCCVSCVCNDAGIPIACTQNFCP